MLRLCIVTVVARGASQVHADQGGVPFWFSGQRECVGQPEIKCKLDALAAKLCARLGKASLVIVRHWPGDSKEPYEVNLHVRDCGGSAG